MSTANISINEKSGVNYSRNERVVSTLHPSYNPGSGVNFARYVKSSVPVVASFILDDTTNNLTDGSGNKLTF